MNIPSSGNFTFAIIAFTVNESGFFTINYSVTHSDSEFFHTGIVTQSTKWVNSVSEFMEIMQTEIMTNFRNEWLTQQTAEALKNYRFTQNLDFNAISSVVGE
jgi:hypothetical protein